MYKENKDKVNKLQQLLGKKKPSKEEPAKELNKPRYFDDERNKKKLVNPPESQSPIRTCVFDLETTSLNGTFGRILCGVVDSFDPYQTKVFRADEYPSWRAGKRSNDKELVKDILDYLQDFDVVIAHNGLRFDLRMLRTRAIINELNPLNPLKIIDPVLLCRGTFKFHSNRLDAIAQALHCENQKTPLDWEAWNKAVADGDTEAMDLIVEHCIADVKTLTEVTFKIRKYVKQIDVLGSWRS